MWGDQFPCHLTSAVSIVGGVFIRRRSGFFGFLACRSWVPGEALKLDQRPEEEELESIETVVAVVIEVDMESNEDEEEVRLTGRGGGKHRSSSRELRFHREDELWELVDASSAGGGRLMDSPPAESSMIVTSLAPIETNNSDRNPSMVDDGF